MKAKELIKLLERHPDMEIKFVYTYQVQNPTFPLQNDWLIPQNRINDVCYSENEFSISLDKER
jgi:hypothetical protein